MAGVNKVIIVGNLGADPEIRSFENGAKRARLSIATTEYYTDRNSGQRNEITEWHNVILWRGLADTAEKYLRKGMQVYIEGKLRTRSWQDQNGQNRYTTEVVADIMNILGRKADSPQAAEPQVQTAPETATQSSSPSSNAPVSEEDNDLPF